MYLRPSSFESLSCILRIGNGFLSILLLNSLKSDMKQTGPFFLGIINVCKAQSELFLRFKAPMFTNLLIAFFRVSTCAFGIGN